MIESEKKNKKVSMGTLKGMQSVRATFTLPQNTIALLSIVANQLGIKQKSIFDHLVENRQILYQIAEEARDYQPKPKQRKQKTFVLSKNSLTILDAFAKEFKLPRDVVVEFSIKQLYPVVAEEKERHENRKILLKDMEGYRKASGQLLEKVKQLIGEDDPVSTQLEYIFNLYDKNIEELRGSIEKGKCVEEFK